MKRAFREIVRAPGMGDARQPSLIANAMSNWGSLLVISAIGLILTPYLINRLDTAQYGVWTLVSSIVGYYGLLDMGVTAAMMRYTARYAAKRDYTSLNQVVNTSLALFMAVGVVIVGLSVVTSGPLARFFGMEASFRPVFRTVLLLLGITAAFDLAGNVLSVVILAHEHFVLANAIRVSVSLVRVALYLTVLYAGGKLVSLSWVNVAVGVMSFAGSFLVTRTKYHHVSFSPRMVDRSSAKALITFGVFAFISRLGDLFRFRLDSAVIGRYMNMSAVGVYNLGAILVGYIMSLVISCSGVTQPRLAALAAIEDRSIFRARFISYSNVVSLVGAGACFVSLLVAKSFYSMWLPDRFQDVAGASSVFYILLLGLTPDLMSNVSNNALQAVKKHRFIAYQTVVEGGTNLLLSILLVERMGIQGVAIGTAIPAIVTKLIVQPLYCCSALKISYPQYMLIVFVRPLGLIAGLFALFQLTGLLAHPSSPGLLMLKGGTGLAMFGIGAYLLGLTRENRKYAVSVASNAGRSLLMHIRGRLHGKGE